ncbi:hypothetical protein NA57DRAFT_57213 [Rhizodiscina lignyota]|uniref:DUF3533 domain-containing protein n=1 Tax=Rhizodiscina lignyota TaxID=1504668 RepID=A0A9P4IE84_9PEZI|nr:hypothetical protein NA57DRAFT_57213 [Rhizodiscina lignyota]
MGNRKTIFNKIPNRFLNVPDQYNPYNRAHENRVGIRHPSVRKIRNKFFKAVWLNFIVLQVLFLGLFSYLFGSLFQQNSHAHNIKILYVDYDGGVIGDSIRTAYQNLKSNEFPSLIEQPPNGRQIPGDLREEVCQTHFWAVLWTSPGASERLAAAIAGGSAATSYDRTDVLTYAWDEARYSTAADSFVMADLTALASAARVAYSTRNGSAALQTIPTNDQAAMEAFTNPWQLSQINIQPTTQGSRAIYNTLVFILILIQEFFYLGTMNALYTAFKIYERLYPHRIITFRIGISCAYCFIGGLCTTGAIWAFRAGWHVNGAQFVLTWMVLWLFAHLNFLALDAFTVWLPVQFVPMALITWIVFNVTSILLPFELSPGFYHWAYAMPAHEAYLALMDIWSGGCNPQLHIALPILFSWEVVGLILCGFGVHRRCHYAVVGQEEAEAQFQERLAAAMEFERKRDKDRKEGRDRRASVEHAQALEEAEAVEEAEEDVEEARDKVAMSEELRRQDSRLRREDTQGRSVHFGPSFACPFGATGDDDD